MWVEDSEAKNHVLDGVPILPGEKAYRGERAMWPGRVTITVDICFVSRAYFILTVADVAMHAEFKLRVPAKRQH